MKRSMSGGTHRGPVAHDRQRRTIRLMQLVLVLIASGLLVFAGYSLGRVTGYDEGRRAGSLGAPRRPAAAQVVILGMLGIGAFAAALMLGGPAGVRVPTPARLEELTGRAETAALERAERAAISSEKS